MSIAMVKNADGIILAILLTILGYDFEVVRTVHVHVYSDWHPRNRAFHVNV